MHSQQQQQQQQAISGAVSRNSSRHRNLPPLPSIMHNMNNNVTPTNSTAVVPAPVPHSQPQQQQQQQPHSIMSMPMGSGPGGMSQPSQQTCASMSAGDRMSQTSQPPPIQPRYLSFPIQANEHGPNNFATIRTTSIVTKQQKEHMQVKLFFLIPLAVVHNKTKKARIKSPIITHYFCKFFNQTNLMRGGRPFLFYLN